MRRLMIVDSSDIVRKVGRRILSGADFLVSEASDADQALERAASDFPDVVIIDANIEGALDLITQMRRRAGDREFRIYYSLIENDMKKMMAARRAGATDFLMKPFDRRSLMAAFDWVDRAA
ncbi:MAG: response regulator [Proteobacteria bacterium]|nr:response regulator [Pseudomonadota bacterium]